MKNIQSSTDWNLLLLRGSRGAVFGDWGEIIFKVGKTKPTPRDQAEAQIVITCVLYIRTNYVHNRMIGSGQLVWSRAVAVGAGRSAHTGVMFAMEGSRRNGCYNRYGEGGWCDKFTMTCIGRVQILLDWSPNYTNCSWNRLGSCLAKAASKQVVIGFDFFGRIDIWGMNEYELGLIDWLCRDDYVQGFANWVIIIMYVQRQAIDWIFCCGWSDRLVM